MTAASTDRGALAIALIALALAGALQAAAPTPARSSPEALALGERSWSMLTLNHDQAAAHLVWMQTTRSFAMQQARCPHITEQVETIGALSPEWTTPWAYGALMCQSLGDQDGHEALLEAAAMTHPDDPWFAYQRGVAAYLNHGDRGAATWWLQRAQAQENAPAGTDAILEILGSQP